MISKSIIKYILIIVGSISLVLGLIGIAIPVLPTTPFLLLASFCYIRSSKHLYNWLINHRIFGPYIYNYVTYKSVKRNTKILALTFLWVSLGFSIFLVPSIYLKILFLLAGTSVTIYLLKLKTLYS